MTRVLNPALYARITAALRTGQLPGEQILVSKPGQPMVADWIPNPLSPDHPLRRIHEAGEEYRVCCPACGDTRHRLYINHMWDPASKATDNIFLVHCFNESCESRENFIRDLKQLLSATLLETKLLPSVKPIAVSSSDYNLVEERVISPPGPILPLTALDENHPAIVFLKSRGFDPARLSAPPWNAGWCEESRMRSARRRLYVPLTFEGKLRGWQARYIGVDGSGDCSDMWSCTDCKYEWYSPDVKPSGCSACNSKMIAKIPKWFTCPGMQRSRVFYNYDSAAAWPFLVICEGPTDTIRFGSPKNEYEAGPAVSVLGHGLSNQQETLISRQGTWRKNKIFLAFDGDLWVRPAERAKLNTLVDKLRSLTQTPDVVVPLVFHPDKDPGDYTHKDLWEFVRSECTRLKTSCPF